MGIFSMVSAPSEYLWSSYRGPNEEQTSRGAIFLSRTLSGLFCKDLAAYFGCVSGALITMMHSRLDKEMTGNRRLKREIERVKQ